MAGELYLGQWQLGRESVYGVAVAATRIVYPDGNPVFARTRPPRPHSVATGNRLQQRFATLGPSEVGSSVTIGLSASELLEWAAITLQGGVNPTTPTGAVNGRQFLFTGGGATLDSATAEYNDGATAYRAYGVYGNQLKISGDANAGANAQIDLFAVERQANALTGALSSRTPTLIEGFETLCMIDAFGGTPGVTQIPNFLQKWDITFGNGLQRKHLANNRNVMQRAVLSPITMKAVLTVEAATAQAAAELTNWDAGTRRMVSLRMGYNRSINPIAGDSAINEVQTLTAGGTWSAGTYVLTILGQATSAIAFGANAATIQTALNTALAALGSGYTVAVTGGPLSTTPIVVTFSGTEVAGKNVPMIVADISLVTGTVPTVSVVQTTPGYEAAEGITVDMPGFWDAVDVGQTDMGTRMYQLSLDYLYDPTNAFAFRLTSLCGRSAIWS
jgi:hypothetical protein